MSKQTSAEDLPSICNRVRGLSCLLPISPLSSPSTFTYQAITPVSCIMTVLEYRELTEPWWTEGERGWTSQKEKIDVESNQDNLEFIRETANDLGIKTMTILAWNRKLDAYIMKSEVGFYHLEADQGAFSAFKDSKNLTEHKVIGRILMWPRDEELESIDRYHERLNAHSSKHDGSADEHT